MRDIYNKYKLPIIIAIIVILCLIIFLIARLSNKEEVTYQDTLYYITVKGENPITIYLDDSYIEKGYSAMDEDGNDVTNDVVITNNVDTSKIGNYTVSYTLGNITKERIVKVIAKPVGATYIHLYGDVNTYLYVGEIYQEKGYEVVDTVDGANLNDKVTIKSDVDTSKEGIYKVSYTVTNTSGVTTSQERTVIVMDRSLSLLPNTNTLTNKNIMINIYAKDELFSYVILPNNIKVTDRISTYEVNSNGTYKFVMYNTKGESKEKTITISNIDKEGPNGSCSGYYQSGYSMITVKASDNAGISKYVVNGTSYTTSSIKATGELKQANVTIYDNAGNTKTISCNLENKNLPTPTPTKAPTPTPKPDEKIPLNVSAGTNVRSDYDSEMRYVEVMPSGATTNMPLVIYLDGAWSYASFPDNVLSRSITTYVKNGSAYSETGEKFLYVSPRYVISDGKNGGLNWYGSHGPREAKKIAGLIDHLYKKYKIDKKRVYVTGVSLGGDGVWYLVNAYPTTFAAGTVVSGCPFDASASNFKTTPILGINGTGATERRAGYNTCVPSMVSRINSAGGTAVSRVKSGWDHGNMISVYSTDKDVFKWMFKYKRS